MAELEWNGAKVEKDVVDALKLGALKVASDASQDASADAPYDQGTLSGSIRPAAAKVKGTVVSVLWGSWDVLYAIYQELGTKDKTGKQLIAPKLFLTKAKQKHYPKLWDHARTVLRARGYTP